MSTASDLAALASDFPGWHVWRARSVSGAETDWHATARRPGADGTRGRLAAPDVAALRELLAQQEALKAVVAA
jgi:hypothetical protein